MEIIISREYSMQRKEENKTSEGQDHLGDLVTDKGSTLMDLSIYIVRV